jgi:hypothetical protein
MKFRIKKFNESQFPETSLNFPKEISLYTSNGNFTYELRNVYNDGSSIKSTYFKKFDDVETKFLPIDEPSNFYIELHMHTNYENQQKFIVDVVYGKSPKFQFTIEKMELDLMK